MILSNSALMRDADNTAIHVRGIPSTLLMTNAASHVAQAALEIARSQNAYIFCGSGNNGGDGVAAALVLLRRGWQVCVLLVGSREKLSADTAEMERRLREMGGVLEDFEPEEENLAEKLDSAGVIIDAMYGIGLNSDMRGKGLTAARLINAASAPVVSADIASGVEADTGRILGEAVRADITVTFSLAKPGHYAEPGCICAGEVRICDIGIPKSEVSSAGTNTFAVTKGEHSLPRRAAVSHKSDYGKLLIVGGCVGYTGAPSLCASAAVRSGAGLVYLGVPQDIYGITAVKNAEAMPFPLPSSEGKLSFAALNDIKARLDNCDTAVIGCGLGRSDELSRMVRQIVEDSPCRLVLDADGLFALGSEPEVLRRARKSVVLTPHEGEFARMGGVLTGDRQNDARVFAQKYGCILVLKGHRTVVAFPDGEVYIICAGNAGMAKGGSGDALAGVIGAMLCQLPEKDAVITAAWLHARAGDIACERYGEYSMTPSDLIDALALSTQELL